VTGRPVALLEAGVMVVVITPRQVKNLRSRYGAAGNKDDRFDAFVLAVVPPRSYCSPPTAKVRR
jgi:transposase